MTDRSITAMPLTAYTRSSRTFGRNRVCLDEECSTTLSMYNSGKYCYQHEPKIQPRTRGRKIA